VVREALRERFLAALREKGGSAGNGRLQAELGWQDGTYAAVRDELLEEGLVVRGRGRGGSVALTGEGGASPAPTAAGPEQPPDPAPSRRGGARPAQRPNGGSGFEQTFRAIDNVLWKEDGPTTELDYTEQTSWMLFLKYLDDVEAEREAAAMLDGRPYRPVLDADYRWGAWAAPRKADGSFDHDTALTGDDLIAYVNGTLWPYLQSFKRSAAGPDTIEYKIGEVFSEIRSKFLSGYSLRDALELVDGLRFRSQVEKHELSHLYEAKLQNMGNAGRNGGEYYTPRPLIRAMIRVVQPRIGERIYDGACGSAGFLCEAYEHMKPQARSTADHEALQRRTFFAKEKKSLAYILAIMNMILHGIEAPNVIRTNTLAENVMDLQERDRFDVVLANPPFGGNERAEVQQNFPIRSGETAYLFLQHFMRSLRAGGRAAIVIKNTFLSNMDGASTALRRELLETCDLHTILDMPQGTFQGAGVKTVVLFFEKGRPTRRIWYYRLDPGRSLGKTTALDDADMAAFVTMQAGFEDGPQSWTIAADTVDRTTWDLSVRNPNAPEAAPLRSPEEILDEIAALDAESARLLERVRALL
jgi:type I restriction enzyme M protein